MCECLGRLHYLYRGSRKGWGRPWHDTCNAKCILCMWQLGLHKLALLFSDYSHSTTGCQLGVKSMRSSDGYWKSAVEIKSWEAECRGPPCGRSDSAWDRDLISALGLAAPLAACPSISIKLFISMISQAECHPGQAYAGGIRCHGFNWMGGYKCKGKCVMLNLLWSFGRCKRTVRRTLNKNEKHKKGRIFYTSSICSW